MGVDVDPPIKKAPELGSGALWLGESRALLLSLHSFDNTVMKVLLPRSTRNKTLPSLAALDTSFAEPTGLRSASTRTSPRCKPAWSAGEPGRTPATKTLPEPLYRLAVKTFGQHSTNEMIYLVGLYSMVSTTLNGFNVPVPERE